MNNTAFVDVNTVATCSESNVFSDVSDCTIISVLPVTMRTIAVKSYFQMKTSPRQVIDRIALTMIPVDEFAVNRVKSANGSMPTFEYKYEMFETYKHGSDIPGIES